MTEAWDKIWTDVNIDSISPESNISNQWVKNILVRLRDEGDKIVEENRQLREAMESSVEEIKDKLYSAWYQAGIKQGGTLYTLELDRKKFADQIETIKDVVVKYDKYDYAGEMEIIRKILGVNE